METQSDVLVAGHICLDVTPMLEAEPGNRIDAILRPGQLVNVGPARLALGGPVANTGLALKRFGIRIQAAAGIGDDPFGQVALRLLNQEGIGDSIKVTPGGTTSYTIVLAPPGIDRIFLHCPGKNDDFAIDDIDWEAARGARLFHFGYPPLMRSVYEHDGEMLTAILRRAKAVGATTSLDMSLPDPNSKSGLVDWERILSRALPHVDFFLPSIEEIHFMIDREDYLRLRAGHPREDLVEHERLETYRRLAGSALEMGCGVCVIKTARRGYYLRSGEERRLAAFGSWAKPAGGAWARRELWAPAYRAERIVSATGSGDASIAGFLAAFLRGLGPEACMQRANAAGQHNLRALDALSGLPDWPALERFVADRPALEDPRVGAPLIYDEMLGMWRGERAPASVNSSCPTISPE